MTKQKTKKRQYIKKIKELLIGLFIKNDILALPTCGMVNVIAVLGICETGGFYNISVVSMSVDNYLET